MDTQNSTETLHLKVLNQYIKDLSYENFQENNIQNHNINENNTTIDIKVIHETYGENNFGVIIKIIVNSELKKDKSSLFHLELDYFGLFQLDNAKNYDKNKLSSEGAKIIFPFARSVIANVTQNGGSIPIILDNLDFNLLKS